MRTKEISYWDDDIWTRVVTSQKHVILFTEEVIYAVFSWASWWFYLLCVSHENPSNSNIRASYSIVLFSQHAFSSFVWFLLPVLLPLWGISPFKSWDPRRGIQLWLLDPVLANQSRICISLATVAGLAKDTWPKQDQLNSSLGLFGWSKMEKCFLKSCLK